MKVTLDLGNSSFSFWKEGFSPDAIPWGTAETQIPSLFNVNDLILYCSVNRQFEPLIKHYYPQAKKVGTDLPYPLNIKVSPSVGGDRILAAYGGYLQNRSATIVVDCGTAITLDFVNAQKEFLGGLIFPGPRLLSTILHQECSLLPYIYPVNPTERFLGKTTEEAITIGISQGLCGLVDRVISGIRKEFQNPEIPVFTTGGASEAFLKPLGFPFVPDLIHQGLRACF
ncbi:MAG: type III pantothenate kinase [Planctomycetota bacterium]